MEESSQTVRLQSQAGSMEAELCFGEGNDTASRANCWLKLTLPGKELRAEADDFFFECLLSLRRELEQLGLQVCVNGASRNVWPSGMNRSMGAGLLAYRMTLGKQALTADLVNIFDLAPDAQPSSIAAQEAFRDAWYRSL